MGSRGRPRPCRVGGLESPIGASLAEMRNATILDTLSTSALETGSLNAFSG